MIKTANFQHRFSRNCKNATYAAFLQFAVFIIITYALLPVKRNVKTQTLYLSRL